MVGIIAFNDLHVVQFLYKYTNVLDENNIQYDVIYWNRSLIKENVGFKGNSISFDYKTNTYQPFYKKIFSFVKYVRFVKKIIKEKKYNKLIVLSSQSAISLSLILLTRYNKKFIYDYRDITKEPKSRLYKFLIKRLLDSAYCVMISSKGFLDYLNIIADNRYILAHNTREPINLDAVHTKKEDTNCLTISYWGMVRQVDFNQKICNVFGNDSRYKIFFHGDGYYKELENYCKIRGFKNISFTGRYPTSKISEFVTNTNILNCIYDNDVNTMPTIAVKFYDAIRYRLPLLINKGSYLDKYTKDLYGIKAIDIGSKDVCDDIYKWYKNLDFNLMNEEYKKVAANINKDDLFFKDKLLDFVK